MDQENNEMVLTTNTLTGNSKIPDYLTLKKKISSSLVALEH